MSPTTEAPTTQDLPYLDLESEAWAADPWAEIHKLRTADPRGGRLARSRRGIEVLAYDLYASVTADRALETLHTDNWAEQGAGQRTLDFVDNGHLLTFDPERHLKVRRIMVAAFRMSHIEQRRGWFAELAHGLVDGFAAQGHCNLVDEFSHRYSIEILCAMIGVPAEDIPRFEQATLDMALLNAFPLAPGTPKLEAALKTIWDYSTEIVERRRVEPQEDFITGLIRAQETEGKVSEAESVWGVANLLFAGHDTTRYQLAATVAGAVRGGVWEELAQTPTLAPQAVEEGIRLLPVVHLTNRVVKTDDYVLDGLPLPEGTILRLNWFGFNRDPERFVDPDRFDLHREDFDGRVAFGVGVHKCIGHALARADLEVAVEVLSARLADVEVADDVAWHAFTGGMGGPKQLPLTFRAR